MQRKELTIINFFAGIGGLSIGFHKAAQKLAIPIRFLEHVDISAVCRDVWVYNNPNALEVYSLKDVSTYCGKLEGGGGDIWLISPPCQPFTRGGNEKGEADPRAQPFMRIVEILKAFNERDKPLIVFIENVPEFENSFSYSQFKSALGDQYEYIQKIVSPEELGIPYCRTRFYAMAIKRSILRHSDAGASARRKPNVGETSSRSVKDFMDLVTVADDGSVMVGKWPLEALLVNRETLKGMKNFRFDIINPRTTCIGTITGGYGSRIGRQGPLVSVDQIIGDRFRFVSEGERIRRLTPEEILRFHGFPSNFSFPKSMRLKNIYKLLGNSVSIDAAESVMIEGLRMIAEI